jgi:predicted tellurium resistance membrane protein TerC
MTSIMKLTTPLFSLFNRDFSFKSMMLIGGGLFLIAKATFEIHDKLGSASQNDSLKSNQVPPRYPLIQIVLLDIVFSIDSVIAAVGMAQQIWVMVFSVVLAVGVMLFAAGAIGEFVEKYPSIKLLALSFLILIGMTLLVDGMGGHIAKGMIYFTIFFSLLVELLSIRFLKKS